MIFVLFLLERSFQSCDSFSCETCTNGGCAYCFMIGQCVTSGDKFCGFNPPLGLKNYCGTPDCCSTMGELTLDTPLTKPSSTLATSMPTSQPTTTPLQTTSQTMPATPPLPSTAAPTTTPMTTKTTQTTSNTQTTINNPLTTTTTTTQQSTIEETTVASTTGTFESGDDMSGGEEYSDFSDVVNPIYLESNYIRFGVIAG